MHFKGSRRVCNFPALLTFLQNSKSMFSALSVALKATDMCLAVPPASSSNSTQRLLIEYAKRQYILKGSFRSNSS